HTASANAPLHEGFDGLKTRSMTVINARTNGTLMRIRVRRPIGDESITVRDGERLICGAVPRNRHPQPAGNAASYAWGFRLARRAAICCVRIPLWRRRHPTPATEA